ncbi:hypothetical protein HDZ31DRAFT_59622 [Schizophyllum fasciatum]
MSDLPPIYSRQDPDAEDAGYSGARPTSLLPPIEDEPQILIIPPAGAINFQKGFLGADNEKAAVEGELQIKGAQPGAWDKVTITLRSAEAAYSREIELSRQESVVYERNPESDTLPSSIPFALPLTDDTAQSIMTPRSSLSHRLSVTLHPTDASRHSVTQSLLVHTRRYTSHSHSVAIAPETHCLQEPTRVEVQVPRTTFFAGESIPVYVTVPPPSRELVMDRGLRLRNVRAELVRVIKVKREEDDPEDESDEGITGFDDLGVSKDEEALGTVVHESTASTSHMPVSPLFMGSSHRTTLARSGASCRFHSSRKVQLRFVLHQQSFQGSPSDFPVSLPPAEQQHSDADCPPITQHTLLHSITFKINTHISFVDVADPDHRRERISTVSIPVLILPPPAPLPEVSQDVDTAYHKKHDRPPAHTIRAEEDNAAPHYSEGEAGPSAVPIGAPPPFEEREAPPPFSISEASTSSGNRLPTFLESENEIIIPTADASAALDPPYPDAFPGEGAEYGFLPAHQFDGHSEDMQRPSTPPPTLEMATRDADLTQIADIREPERAIEALGHVLDQHEESTHGGEPPPPPPAMDDPSDPPPSIDSDFRSPDATARGSPPLHASASPPPPVAYVEVEVVHGAPSSPPPQQQPQQPSHVHDPPPYLGPESHREQEEHVTRPPPYMG